MNPETNSELDRSISLFQATVYGVGIILGAGIYALIGEAAGVAGNLVWMSFLVAALIATCSAVSYAELSALYPKSAAEYFYVKTITGSTFLGFLTGYLTVLTGVISVAAVALGFSSYFKIFGSLNPVLVGISVIVLSAVLNHSGIQQSARVNTVFTFIEASGLIFVIIIGFSYLGNVDLFTVETVAPSGDAGGLPAVFAAAALVFFAYIGFEDVANIAEETRSARRNVPLAVFFSLVITTVIYILVAMVAVSVVPGTALFDAASLTDPGEGPLALVASTAMGSPLGGQLFTVVALCATANTVLVLNIVSSRMLYGMSKEGSLPAFLGKINLHRKTPTNAIIICTLLCVLFTLPGSLGDVAKLTNVGVFLTFFIVNLMLLLHRFKTRHISGDEAPGRLLLAGNVGWFPVLPAFGALFCLAMLLTQFWDPMQLLGVSLPIVVHSALLIALGIPVFFLARPGGKNDFPG